MCVARRVNGHDGHPNFLTGLDRRIAPNPFNHERKVRVSVQLCNPQRVVGQIGLLANHATEIVRVGKDNVGGDVILFGQFKLEKQSAAVVVGPITKRQVRQPVRRRVVVDVVDGCHRGLREVGEVDVPPEVVDRHGDEQFHARLNQTRNPLRQITVFRGVQCIGKRNFDGIGSLVNPLLVEAETAADTLVGPERCVRKGKVFHRRIGHPNGVGSEVFHR